jgi:hypothetical protein
MEVAVKSRAKAAWSAKNAKNNKSREQAGHGKKAPRGQRGTVRTSVMASRLAGSSLEQLAAEQGVKPLSDPRVLIGGWPKDDDLDEFLEEVYRTRSLL